MGVLVSDVSSLWDHLHICLVVDINNCESVLIVAETDFTSIVVGVRSMVVDTLSIMDVAILSEAASEFGVQAVGDINNMKSTCDVKKVILNWLWVPQKLNFHWLIVCFSCSSIVAAGIGVFGSLFQLTANVYVSLSLKRWEFPAFACKVFFRIVW